MAQNRVKSLTHASIREIVTGDYLPGDHINTFQEIVALQTEFNPQNVFFIGALEFVRPVVVPHIQILSGNPTSVEQITHWICTYYDGQNIHVYDSLNFQRLSPEQQQYLYQLFPHHPPVIYDKVQQQPNMVDCGVFAIAFATSIVNHRNPADEVYDHAKMRLHLLNILNTTYLEPFPTVVPMPPIELQPEPHCDISVILRR